MKWCYGFAPVICKQFEMTSRENHSQLISVQHLLFLKKKKNFLYNFKDYSPFTVITKYWLYSPGCIKHPWACFMMSRLCLPLFYPCIFSRHHHLCQRFVLWICETDYTVLYLQFFLSLDAHILDIIQRLSKSQAWCPLRTSMLLEMAKSCVFFFFFTAE